MSYRNKRRNRTGFWERFDNEVLEASSENFRIFVDQAFQEFLSNASTTEYSFPSTLNHYERKYIHQKAAANSLISRSHGKDPNRVLTISKRMNKSNFESFYIDLCPAAKKEIKKLPIINNNTDVSRNLVKFSCVDKVFGRVLLGEPPYVQQPRTTSELQQFQQQLPIYPMKNSIIEAINDNQVVIVSSETGSGKTTQIPQYILEDYSLKSKKCRIICTQPRRISAVSVAARVSEERGSELGEVAGYHIRLESKLSMSSNIIFCTNGVLLRSLMCGDKIFSSVTHIIIDEVHERDKLSDFLLICLREALKKFQNIKLILMSATINIEKWQEYFHGAFVINIPGRLFSIEEFFLEDILAITGYDKEIISQQNHNCTTDMNDCDNFNYKFNQHFDEMLDRCLYADDSNYDQRWTQLMHCILSEELPINYQHSETFATPLLIAVVKRNLDVVERLCHLGADVHLQTVTGCTAMTIAEENNYHDIIVILKKFSQSEPQDPRRSYIAGQDLLRHYYKTITDEDINYELVTKLICKIHNEYDEGSILVFLPGYDDIMLCSEYLLQCPDLDRDTYRIFYLHGSMNIKEQSDVFKRSFIRKIILSTNIAETSLTIDDVVYVVDCGKAKIQTYDSCSGLSSLQVQWISKACVKQRAGRAGRTRAGICYHLFSKNRYESFLDERIPEILRVPLEELCLNTKTLAPQFPTIYNFLELAPDPPSATSIKTAIENLECLGALDQNENLTPLGEYLSQLTIEPHLGKMLIYSVVFKCLDPILTIVSCLAQKDPFQLPPQANLRSNAAERRKSLTASTYSDHMIYLKAFIKWQESVKYRKERNFCREFFISSTTMDMILKTRAQLMGQLRAAKFVLSNGISMAVLNSFSDNWPIIKAVISAGLYPKLVFKKNGQFCTRTEKKISVHHSSALGKENLDLWMVYDDLVKFRNCHQIRGVTPVTPLTISLMCGVKVSFPQENYLNIDDWLEFEFSMPEIVRLRKLIDNIIEKKLLSPINQLTETEEIGLQVLSEILLLEDKAVNMTIPTGIKFRPLFFELRRDYDHSNKLQIFWYNTDDDKIANHHGTHGNYSNDQQPSTSSSPYDMRLASSRPLPFDHSPYNHNSHDGRSGGSGSYRYGNFCNNFQQMSFTNYSFGQNYHQSRHQNNWRENMDGGPSTQSLYHQATHSSSGQTAGSTFYRPSNQELYNSVFLLIRVKEEKSIRIAQQTNRWVFSPQTERKILDIIRTRMPIYLIYTVHNFKRFYGIAKFLTFDKYRYKLTASIEWKLIISIPYGVATHIRNSLNYNRIIFDGPDGQSIAPDAAIQLWELHETDGT